MNETTEMWKELRKSRQKYRAKMKVVNTAIIRRSWLPFEVLNNGETITFRVANHPKVDFFPSTGTWIVCGRNKKYRGGAKNFLNWYEKQKCSN